MTGVVYFGTSLVSEKFSESLLSRSKCVCDVVKQIVQFVTHPFQSLSLSYVGTVPSLRSGAVRLGQEILSRVFTSNLTFG